MAGSYERRGHGEKSRKLLNIPRGARRGGWGASGLGGLRVKGRLVCVLARMQAERRVVDTAQLPEEEEEEDGAGKDVEDTVPNHLGGDRDDVAALCTCPCDGVEEEEQRQVACCEEVSLAEDASSGEGRVRTMPQKDVPGCRSATSCVNSLNKGTYQM